MSIIIKSGGFNTPRAILDYVSAKNQQFETVIVLRRSDIDGYYFIATNEYADFEDLVNKGFSVIEVFQPGSYSIYDRQYHTEYR